MGNGEGKLECERRRGEGRKWVRKQFVVSSRDLMVVHKAIRSVVHRQANNGIRNTERSTVPSVPVQAAAYRELREGKSGRTGVCNMSLSTGQVHMTVDELMRSDAETRVQFAPHVVEEIEEQFMPQQEAMEQLDHISMMLEEGSKVFTPRVPLAACVVKNHAD